MIYHTISLISHASKRVPEKHLLYLLCQSLWLCGSQQTVEILKEMRIADHLTRLLRNPCAGQEATVRTGHETMDWFHIGKGVCQGCILSPCLFNFYTEYIIQNAGLDEAQASQPHPSAIKISGRNISNLWYTDDTIPMAEGEEELKSLLMKVKEESKKVGLKLNIQKTKIMASGPITSLQIDGETMETVTDIIFWGSKITADGDCSHEIKRCLLLAVQESLKSLLQHHSSKASIPQHLAFFIAQLSHPNMTNGKTIALTRRTFVGKLMSLLLNMLSRLVIAFLPRSKHLLISWLQSLFAVVLKPKKITFVTVSIFSPNYLP